MPVISGPITALAGDSTARVYVAATEVHPHAGGVMTDEPCRVSITNGVLSFEAPEGVGVLTIKTVGGVEKTLPIVVKEGYTLADALLAGDVEALPVSKIDELAERLAGMEAGDQADLAGKLEETGDGELTVGGGFSSLILGEPMAEVSLPSSTYLRDNGGRDDRVVSLEQEIEYFHAALTYLSTTSGVVMVPPKPNRGYLGDIAHARGLDSSILEALPFDIDTRMCVDMSGLFEDWRSLKELGGINAYSATRFSYMFSGCKSLERIGVIGPASNSSSVFDFRSMFYGCESLKDGKVMIICNPEAARNSDTTGMIDGSGLTRKPFYTPMGEPIEIP